MSQAAARMTGGEAVVGALRANRVTTVFGIPGAHNLPIYDALYHARGDIRHITARHEGGAGLMADGYARATGEPGVAVVTTGPAAGNIMAALGDAFRDSVPLLVIASQIASGMIGQDRGAFHEMRDQLGMASAIAAWGRRVMRVADIPAAINEAWIAMTAGRPRPAYIELPKDVLAADDLVTISPACKPAPPQAAPGPVADAARMLREAERPLIYAGGGVHWSRASLSLARLAGRLSAPVATTCNGKGAIPDDHPCALGYVDFTVGQFLRIWQEADLVLAVGTDFDGVGTHGWRLPRPQRLIHIDIDPAQIGRNIPVTLGLAGDAARVLGQLSAALAEVPGPKPSGWLEQVKAERLRLREIARGQAGLRLVDALQAALGREGIVTGDAASVGIWQLWHQPVYTPRTFLFPLGFGTLGFGLPAALGAQAAYPDRRVICLCGDGGFLFTGQELACAVQHGLNVVTVVVNDNTYGAIKTLQERRYGGRVIAAELVNPDFVALAEAYGAFGMRVSDMSDLPAVLETAFASGKPGLIEVPGPLEGPPTDRGA